LWCDDGHAAAQRRDLDDPVRLGDGRSVDGAIQLTLSPWQQVFDNRVAIFANEPRPAA
jgi:hypothetical protein